MDERRPKALKKRPAAPQHHERSQRELDPVAQSGGEMQPEILTKHGQHQQRQRKRRAHPEPAAHGVVLRVGLDFGGYVHGLERHAADRAATGTKLHNLRMHGAGVTGTFGARQSAWWFAAGRRVIMWFKPQRRSP